MQERDNYKHQIEELKSRCEDRKHKVDEERQKFMEFKKQVAQNALNSRSGRPIAQKVWLILVMIGNSLMVVVVFMVIRFDHPLKIKLQLFVKCNH